MSYYEGTTVVNMVENSSRCQQLVSLQWHRLISFSADLLVLKQVLEEGSDANTERLGDFGV